MPGESLAHILPAALRVALELQVAICPGVRAIRKRRAKEGRVSIDVDRAIANDSRGRKRALGGGSRLGVFNF